MPSLEQGDIFRADSQLLIVFGHVGFNLLNESWRAFRVNLPGWDQVTNPFEVLGAEPRSLPDGRWICFLAAEEHNGMSDGRLRPVLEALMSWATSKGLRSLATNAIMNAVHGRDPLANERSDNQRAQLLIGVMRRYEAERGVKVTLVSLNDVFTRNA